MSNYAKYQKTNNEGGEGYNPYASGEIYGKAESAEPEWSILETKCSRLQDLINATSSSHFQYADYLAELATAQAAYQASYKLAMEG